MSLILHLLAMIILGLLTVNHQIDDEIVLSVRVGPEDRAGAEAGDPDPVAPEFDRPGLPDEESRRLQDEAVRARQDAEELYRGPHDPAGPLPSREEVRRVLASPGSERLFEGRDPRVRRQVLEKEGGTTYTEAAVARGLRWLARHQNEDGSWSLDGFCWAGDCNGRCDGLGDESDSGGTSLALLPFLGAGQTHVSGVYRQEVIKGLRWLVENQRLDGDLRGWGVGRMYAHGQATIVLCEAYAMTRDEALHLPAQLAVDFIVDAQHRAGGWRYEPGQPGDTSVLGWQLMALHSARMAGLQVPPDTLRRASRFLEEVQSDEEGASYGYQRHHSPTPAMTAEALLCRQYLGWPEWHPGLRLAARRFVERYPPDPRDPKIYFWYYASQVLHHMGGPLWEDWNERARAALLAMQETEGHEAGSWAPQGSSGGSHDTRAGGRIYMTSLAVCTLEVYYRHLPLYRAVEVGP